LFTLGGLISNGLFRVRRRLALSRRFRVVHDHRDDSSRRRIGPPFLSRRRRCGLGIDTSDRRLRSSALGLRDLFRLLDGHGRITGRRLLLGSRALRLFPRPGLARQLGIRRRRRAQYGKLRLLAKAIRTRIAWCRDGWRRFVRASSHEDEPDPTDNHDQRGDRYGRHTDASALADRPDDLGRRPFIRI